MADTFDGFRGGLASPMTDGTAVTTSDSTVLTTTRAIFVGGAGNLTVIMANGTTVTLTGVIAGSWLPLRVTKVKATGTTATNIAAFW